MANVKYIDKDGARALVTEVKTRLAKKQDTMQLSVMPEAGEDYEGIVVEFIGATSSPYTHGYFYECVHDTTAGTYSWTPIKTQKSIGAEGTAEGAEIFNSYEGMLEPNTASGQKAHAEGQGTSASGDEAHAEGYKTKASGNNSHTEGNLSEASGTSTHAEGSSTKAVGDYSHAEGFGSQAKKASSHAEGQITIADGAAAHAEGASTNATGEQSHAEGSQTTASNSQAHAEGLSSTASGMVSHAEGTSLASGDHAHSEGFQTTASGMYSHAQGQGTTASNMAGTAIGSFNDPQTGSLLEIGNGTSNSTRSNIFEVFPDHINVKGSILLYGKPVSRQYSIMPSADADHLGWSVQYTGATNASYSQGSYYMCKAVADTDPTEYEWVKVTYNKDEVDSLLSAAGHFEAVDTLPTEDIKTNTIYLIPKRKNISGYADGTNLVLYYKVDNGYEKYSLTTFAYIETVTNAEDIAAIEAGTYPLTSVSVLDHTAGNVKDEYINLDGTSAGWEKIGDTEIDLSGYVKKSELTAITAEELAEMWADD